MPWPVWTPGGQVLWLTPHSSVTRCLPKFATHTLSWPSTAMPHGTVRPPAVNGFGLATPLLLISVTDAFPPLGASPLVAGHGMSTAPELATHMFPWLSAAIPRGEDRPLPEIGDLAGLPSGLSIPTVL